MAEKVQKVGVQRVKGYLYFIDKQGDISRALKAKDALAQKVEKIGIQKETGWLYFIDKQGDISRSKIKDEQSYAMPTKMYSPMEVAFHIGRNVQTVACWVRAAERGLYTGKVKMPVAKRVGKSGGRMYTAKDIETFKKIASDMQYGDMTSFHKPSRDRQKKKSLKTK